MEINFVRNEVVYALNNIHEWIKPERVFLYIFIFLYFITFAMYTVQHFIAVAIGPML